jgi:hypothetical protein
MYSKNLKNLNEWWRGCSGLKLGVFGDFVWEKSVHQVGSCIKWDRASSGELRYRFLE